LNMSKARMTMNRFRVIELHVVASIAGCQLGKFGVQAYHITCIRSA
jgi:hypothetical protein